MNFLAKAVGTPIATIDRRPRKRTSFDAVAIAISAAFLFVMFVWACTEVSKS